MSRTTRIVAAALTAAAILPSAAQAAPTGGTSDIARHLERATAAGERLERLVAAGRDRSALVALKTARRETTAASRDARRLAVRATSDTAVSRAIWSLAAAGAAQGTTAGDLAGLLGDSDGKLQQAIAQGLPSSLASRDAVIAALNSLIARIDDPELEALAAQALAALAAQTPATLEELAAIPTGELPARISALVQTAMQSVAAALDLVTTNLAALVPMLPAAAQGPVRMALSTMSTVLNGFTPMLAGMSATITSTIEGVLDMVTGLLPKLPGSTDSTGSTSTGGGLLGGLIPDLGSIVPGFGGLLDGLLGNLPIIGGLLRG